MFEVKASTLICTLKEQLLGRQPYDDVMRAMWFKLDASLNYYGYQKDGNTPNGYGHRTERRNIFFVFTGNTTVFCAVEGDDDRWFDITDIPLDRWEYTSSHDSCWRSDGVDSPLSRLYFEWYKRIMSGTQNQGEDDEQSDAFCEIPQELQPAPRDLHQHTTLGGLGQCMGFGSIELTEVPDPNHWMGRRTVIKALTPETD